MVAYNFQTQFADAVAARTKRQTIRAERRSGHARVGEPVQLYTGMRTKNCRKIVDPDPICKAVLSVVMTRYDLLIDGEDIRNLSGFAEDDGFRDWQEMRAWFEDTHGLPFYGWLIAWH